MPLAALLAARDGVEVRGGSSDPSRVDLDGVTPTAFSWDDPAGWPAAANGVDAVFVVRPDRADAPELVAALVDVLPPAARVVLLSEQDADYEGPDGWAPRVERVVRDGGRPWTILRPSWFLQVLTDPRFYREAIERDGELPFPAGEARLAWVDARDIAAVADRALVEDGHDGRTYDVTGPEALSLPETAAVIAEATGRPVVHRDVTIEEGLAGLSGFERDLTELTFERVRAGSFTPVSDDVERVTGRPSGSLAEFLADVSLSFKV